MALMMYKTERVTYPLRQKRNKVFCDRINFLRMCIALMLSKGLRGERWRRGSKIELSENLA
jgi:hypothetical protein